MKRRVICVFFDYGGEEPSLVHIFGSKKGALEFIKTIPQDKKPLYFVDDWEVIDV